MIQTIILYLIFNYMSLTHDMLFFLWSINVFVPFDHSPEEGRARQVVQISEFSGSCSTDENLHCSGSVVKHNETPRDGHNEKVVISTKICCLIVIFNMYDFL